MSLFITQIQVEADIAGLLPADSKARLLIHKYEDANQSVEQIIIGINYSNVLELAFLSELKELDRKISRELPIVNKITPFNLLTFVRENGQLILAPLSPLGEAPNNPEELETFVANISKKPPGSEALLKPDLSAISLIYSVPAQVDYVEVMVKLREILSGYPDLDVFIGGWLPIYELAGKHVFIELPLLAILAAVFTSIIFFLNFRTFFAVICPTLIITASLVITFGLMALTHTPISLVSLMIPPLLFALGSSYSIHMLSRFYEISYMNANKQPTGPVVIQLLKEVSRTILLASVTTAAGFSSLLLSQVDRLREFGLFAAFGILICATMTILVYSALLSRRYFQKRTKIFVRKFGMTDRLIKFLYKVVEIRKVWIFSPLSILLVLFIWSIPKVNYETDIRKYFRGAVTAIEDNQLLLNQFGSFIDINMTVRTDPGSTGITKDLLRKLFDFKRIIEDHPNISRVMSIASFASLLNYELTGILEPPERVPLISLFQRFVQIGDAKDHSLSRLVNLNEGYVNTRIWVEDHNENWFLSEKNLFELVEFIELNAVNIFPDEFQPEIWGWSLVTMRVSQLLSSEQIMSTLASIGLVLVIVTLVFKSFRYGLLAVVPLITALMLTFVIIALFEISLDALTISFCSVAIGVGVDDAIHFILCYRRLLAVEKGNAIKIGLQQAGRAIILTTLAVVGGLSVLFISGFLPIVFLGVLISVTLIGATIGAVVLLPSLLNQKNR